jgi:hypothetical protein
MKWEGWAATVLPQVCPTTAPSQTYLEGMAKNLAKRPRKRRLPRPTLGRVTAFLSVITLSALLTVFGLAELVGQLGTAQSAKARLIVIILQSGLVVLGPVVLWAYLRLIPRGLLTSITRRLRDAILGPFKRAAQAP